MYIVSRISYNAYHKKTACVVSKYYSCYFFIGTGTSKIRHKDKLFVNEGKTHDDIVTTKIMKDRDNHSGELSSPIDKTKGKIVINWSVVYCISCFPVLLRRTSILIISIELKGQIYVGCFFLLLFYVNFASVCHWLLFSFAFFKFFFCITWRMEFSNTYPIIYTL